MTSVTPSRFSRNLKTSSSNRDLLFSRSKPWSSCPEPNLPLAECFKLIILTPFQYHLATWRENEQPRRKRWRILPPEGRQNPFLWACVTVAAWFGKKGHLDRERQSALTTKVLLLEWAGTNLSNPIVALMVCKPHPVEQQRIQGHGDG